MSVPETFVSVLWDVVFGGHTPPLHMHNNTHHPGLIIKQTHNPHSTFCGFGWAATASHTSGNFHKPGARTRPVAV